MEVEGDGLLEGHPGKVQGEPQEEKGKNPSIPGGKPPCLLRSLGPGFRQDQGHEEGVEEGDAGGEEHRGQEAKPCGKPRPQGGPQDDRQAEGCPQEGHARGAVFPPGDIGHVGLGGG